MRIYKVRISLPARADMVELRKFLKAMMTEEGAVRYAMPDRDMTPEELYNAISDEIDYIYAKG